MNRALTIAAGGVLIGATAAIVLRHRHAQQNSFSGRARKLARKLEKTAKHVAIEAGHAATVAGETVRDQSLALAKELRRSNAGARLRALAQHPRAPLVLGTVGGLLALWAQNQRGLMRGVAGAAGLGLLAAAGSPDGGSEGWLARVLST